MMIFGSLITVATASTAATTSSATAADSTGALLVTLVPFALIFVLLYFMMIRPQKKKEKKTQQMRDALQVGDNITTVGGVVGRVVTIREDGIVIETGADRSKLQIKKWAIQSVETLHDNMD
jgi:preprotein translocase subunit YajC